MAFLALVLALSAGAAFLAVRRTPAEPVPTTTVLREDFVHAVTAEGTLEAMTSTPLTVPIDIQEAVKIAWLADDGSRVRKGEVVARFDPTDMEKLLLDGRADKDTASARLGKAEVEGRATLKNLDRDADLAKAELDTAEAGASDDPGIFSRAQIVESEIDQKLARERREHALDTRRIRERLGRNERELVDIEARKADIAIKRAERGLSAMEVTAPNDGLVLIDRDWRGNQLRVGDSVWAGRSVAHIPDLATMEAQVYVLEADAGGLAAGKAATLCIEAHPEVLIKATVKRVDTLAKPRQRGVPVQYFGVTLSLEHTDPAIMKPGERVRARLLLDEVKAALTVPRQAISDRDGKKVVYLLREGRFAPIEVGVGPIGLGRVVIAAGLGAGDRVALGDPNRQTRVSRPDRSANTATAASTP